MSSPPPKLLRAHDVAAPRPLSEPSETALARTAHRGLSLRPDAPGPVDPYVFHRFMPETIGAHQVTVWCPGCDSSLQVTGMWMTRQGLFIEGICYSCGKGGKRPGIYKRAVLPLASGEVPYVEE